MNWCATNGIVAQVERLDKRKHAEMHEAGVRDLTKRNDIPANDQHGEKRT